MTFDVGLSNIIAALTAIAVFRQRAATSFFAAVFWLYLAFNLFQSGTQLQSDFLGLASLGISLTFFWHSGYIGWYANRKGSRRGGMGP